RSQNDIALLNDYLTNAAGSAQPRGLFIQGDGFAQSETQTGGVDPAHTDFLAQKLGLSLRNPSYQSVSGNTNDCTDLITTNIITTNADIYGVSNNCSFSNDLLQRNPGLAETAAASFYENAGLNGPYVASVRKAAVATRNWVALTDGWDVEHLFGRYCDTDPGRISYYYQALSNVFGSICTLAGGPSLVLDTPHAPSGRPLMDAVALFGNPMRPGLESTVRLTLTKRDRVEILLLDLSGRTVRTLASREFSAGEHALRWDGTDDAGRRLARGIYFAQVRYASSGFEGTRKVTILR
ncbi:MAG: FlgD immunoglobulin-like domain containing protein, partial [Candidatus Eisenbacteria bacterium]